MIADYDNNLIRVIHVQYCYVYVINLLNNFTGFVLLLGIYFSMQSMRKGNEV